MELLQIMYDLLEKTLLPDADERAAGERYANQKSPVKQPNDFQNRPTDLGIHRGLTQLQTRPGFVPALFTVAGTAAVRLDVRLGAALYCKNFVRLHWAREGFLHSRHVVFCLSLSVSLSLCPSICLSLCLFPPTVRPSLPPFPSLSLSLFLSLALSLSRSLALPLYLPLSLFLTPAALQRRCCGADHRHRRARPCGGVC